MKSSIYFQIVQMTLSVLNLEYEAIPIDLFNGEHKTLLTEIRDMNWQICTLTFTNEKLAELERIIHSMKKYSG